ncbi:hypothetical protein [Pseudonocardia sp. DLS-67]
MMGALVVAGTAALLGGCGGSAPDASAAIGGSPAAPPAAPEAPVAGSPADPAPVDVTLADLDADGTDDRITVQADPGGGWQLRVDLAGRTVTAKLPTDEPAVLEADRRVSDMDGDRVPEVVVPVSIGANTVSSAVYLYDPQLGLVPVSGPDGHPFFLYEGGGVSAVNGYECADDHDGRSLGLVGVTLREDLPAGGEPRYSGSYNAYSVSDGIVTPVQSTPIEDVAAGDPVLQTDPMSCAPVG